jgi:two-component system, cell cycle sensor histidine kinase and response regulator CckA
MSDPKNRRVLIIDDNPSIHDDFRKILAPATSTRSAVEESEIALFGNSALVAEPPRFEVDSAFQGQEGALLVQEAAQQGRPYAMAFVDVRMPPGWDGVETTQKIWEIDPDVQIVICTAYSDYAWGEMFEKIGHRDGLLILKKPFDAVEASQLAYALTEKWWLGQQSRRKLEQLESRVTERTLELQQSNGALQTEVAQHKQAEAALRQSEQRFSGAFEYAPIGVAMVAPDGHFLKVNRVLCGLVGYSEAELLTRTFQDITHPPDLAADLAHVRRLLAGEIRSYQMEKRYDHARGHLVTVLLDVSLVRDDRDQPLYFISQIQDVTERKRLQAQLLQSQKMETVGKLAGGVAHEFNSILCAVIGRAELLRGDLPPGSPLAANANAIIQAANRAAALTRQLLAYGRKQFLRSEVLDLNRVVASMERMLDHLMGDEVKTRFIPAAGLRAVKADAGQLEQVIVNMAMNARDAMPKGGQLTLETAHVSLDQESAARPPDLKPGDYAVLAITDTGAGMREEVKARIFEPFFTTKDIGQGVGLGLSTCYGIVKQSGGYIGFTSELGQGTTFKLYLPQVD